MCSNWRHMVIVLFFQFTNRSSAYDKMRIVVDVTVQSCTTVQKSNKFLPTKYIRYCIWSSYTGMLTHKWLWHEKVCSRKAIRFRKKGNMFAHSIENQSTYRINEFVSRDNFSHDTWTKFGKPFPKNSRFRFLFFCLFCSFVWRLLPGFISSFLLLMRQAFQKNCIKCGKDLRPYDGSKLANRHTHSLSLSFLSRIFSIVFWLFGGGIRSAKETRW